MWTGPKCEEIGYFSRNSLNEHSLNFSNYVHKELTNKNLLVELFTLIAPSIFHLTCFMVCLDNVLFINVDCGSCTIVLLLWKTNFFFLKCCIFCESHPILMTRFLFSDHLCTVRESAWQNFMRHTLLDSGKVHGKYVFELSTHFQCIHSNSFILSRGFTLIVFSSYGRKNRRTRFVLTKAIGFDFLLFNYMLLSVWIRVQTFHSLLINWIGNFIL